MIQAASATPPQITWVQDENMLLELSPIARLHAESHRATLKGEYQKGTITFDVLYISKSHSMKEKQVQFHSEAYPDNLIIFGEKCNQGAIIKDSPLAQALTYAITKVMPSIILETDTANRLGLDLKPPGEDPQLNSIFTYFDENFECCYL